jgi:hypothetical protein
VTNEKRLPERAGSRTADGVIASLRHCSGATGPDTLAHTITSPCRPTDDAPGLFMVERESFMTE